jgi:hypothetical protein
MNMDRPSAAQRSTASWGVIPGMSRGSPPSRRDIRPLDTPQFRQARGVDQTENRIVSIQARSE